MKEDLPYPHSPKHARRLPTILTPEEVSRLIDSARNVFHYAMPRRTRRLGTTLETPSLVAVAPDFEVARMLEVGVLMQLCNRRVEASSSSFGTSRGSFSMHDISASTSGSLNVN